MIKNIILSETDGDSAQQKFSNALADIYTLLVVLGKGNESKTALENAYDNINNSPFNQSVRCIHAPKPGFIMEQLHDLSTGPGLAIDWDDMDQYLVLSVSNKYNKIAAILTPEEYLEFPETYIDDLIVSAEAADKP